MDTTIKQYKRLEGRIQKGDVGAVLARWEYGRKLLVERGDAQRLEGGRVEELHRNCNRDVTVTGYRMELSRRMRFAEQYKTEAAVRHAFREFGSWSAICARGLLSRQVLAAVAGGPPENEDEWRARRSENPFIREYHAIMGRIRGFMKSRSVPARGLWLAMFEHGIAKEMQEVERQDRLAKERRAAPTLLTQIDKTTA